MPRRTPRPALTALIALSLVPPASAQSTGSRWLDFEGLRYDFSRNDLRKPNDLSGDRFSLLPFADRANTARLSAELPIPWWGTGHRLRLTWAPLSLGGTSSFTAPVRFQGSTFAAATPTTARYDFDTWRATYTVPLLGLDDPGAGWSLRAGGTLAIRDAQIRLTQGGTVQSFDNVGLVPLLNLSVTRALTSRWTFEAELDGAPGPRGSGLLDGVARVRYDLTPAWSLSAGLRHLRGGVDTDELYNSVSSTALSLSARWRF